MSKDETKELTKITFSAIYSDDTFGSTNTIKEFLDDGYLMDPHTATCIKAYNELKEKPLKKLLFIQLLNGQNFSNSFKML